MFKHFPAGIIASAEAQLSLNLNEWVCTDMNICPVDNFGTVIGENPDCLLLSGTVVSENSDHVCWVLKQS